jgi:hypothetical protein
MYYRYFIVLRANTSTEMAEEVLHFAYQFISRALIEQRQQGRNDDYEAFAIELLALLQRNRHLYTTPPEPPEPVLDDADI